jgi:hypothetical protein
MSRRLHEYPPCYYRDMAEFEACRRIAFWHGLTAWIVAIAVVCGFVFLGLSVWALFGM